MQALQVSSSIKVLRYSVIREMAGLAAGQVDIINLGIGEPDFETPPEIIEKAFQEARAGHTHYTPSQGDPELLEKLALLISQNTGIPVQASSVLVTQGGMGALTAALRSILDSGDEVLLVEPHFPDYLGHIALAGGVAKTAVARIENQFIPDPEEIAKAITGKTRILVLNYPNNPTGAVLQGGVLDAIAKVVIHHNLIVVSDEVYDRIIFHDNSGESIITRPEMIERTLVVKSFSKTYAMTGWRIGYCHGPQAIIEQMLKVVNYSTACASSIGQRAAIAALSLDASVVCAMRDRFAARVALVYERLKNLAKVKVIRPQGSFYVFVDISSVTRDSRKFAIQLLQQEKVVVIPGYAFGHSGEGCIRIACTRPREQLAEAMNRIEIFINRYQE